MRLRRGQAKRRLRPFPSPHLPSPPLTSAHLRSLRSLCVGALARLLAAAGQVPGRKEAPFAFQRAEAVGGGRRASGPCTRPSEPGHGLSRFTLSSCCFCLKGSQVHPHETHIYTPTHTCTHNSHTRTHPHTYRHTHAHKHTNAYRHKAHICTHRYTHTHTCYYIR